MNPSWAILRLGWRRGIPDSYTRPQCDALFLETAVIAQQIYVRSRSEAVNPSRLPPSSKRNHSSRSCSAAFFWIITASEKNTTALHTLYTYFALSYIGVFCIVRRYIITVITSNIVETIYLIVLSLPTALYFPK